jgi:hypothetical protein
VEAEAGENSGEGLITGAALSDMADTPRLTRAEQLLIVEKLNQRYGTTLPIEVIEVAIVCGFTTWEALRREVEDDPAL